MYNFIKGKIKRSIIEELGTSILWNTVFKKYKPHFNTDKPIVLLENNLPGELDKLIVNGLAECMNFSFSTDIIWTRSLENLLSLLEFGLNDSRAYVAFCSEDLLRKFGKKIYFSDFCHVVRIEFDQEDLEELLKHFDKSGETLPKEEKFSVGELFLAFFLLSIKKDEYEPILSLVKNIQCEIVDQHLVLVPKTKFLLQHAIELKSETIMDIFGIDRQLIHYFNFYEAIRTTYELTALPQLSKTLLVNMLVSKIILGQLGEGVSLEMIKNFTGFYTLDYFEELERLLTSINSAILGRFCTREDIETVLSSLIQKKFEMLCFSFHGLKYELKAGQEIEKHLVYEDFSSLEKLALLDPIFVKFSNFKYDEKVLSTVIQTQMKHIKDTKMQLDESLFKEKGSRRTNDTKLISMIGNLTLFDIVERIYGQVLISQQTKERFLGFLRRAEVHFFSLNENILQNYAKRIRVANIFDSSQVDFLDDFLRNVIVNLCEIVEGTEFLNDLVDLRKDELLDKFLELYEKNLKELKENPQPKNMRKWSIISFFHDYITDYLIETYTWKRNKGMTNIIDETIEYGQRNGFTHVILLVIDGLSYVHWRLVKPELMKEVKDVATLRKDDFRLGLILSRTPVGHSALFSGLRPFENGVYSDMLRFNDSHVNLMQAKWIRGSGNKILLNPNYQHNIAKIENKISKNIFKGRYRQMGRFYFFTTNKGSPMTLLFEYFLGTKSITPQAKLTKKVEKGELKFSEKEVKKIAHFVFKLENKELKGHVSVVQYPGIDKVMHYSGWNFHYYLDQVQRQLKYLIETVKKRLKGRTLLAITSDHGSISRDETKIITSALPFKFTMKNFDDLAELIPSFQKEINRFSYAYFQLFEDSQLTAVKSFLIDKNKSLKVLTNEQLYGMMGSPKIKELKYPKAFIIPKYLMHFAEYSILRHGGCSLNELLIPFLLIEVGQ